MVEGIPYKKTSWKRCPVLGIHRDLSGHLKILSYPVPPDVETDILQGILPRQRGLVDSVPEVQARGRAKLRAGKRTNSIV